MSGRKLIGSLLLLALCFLAPGSFAEAFFHKKKDPAPAGGDYFKKLGLERPEKKILAPDFTLEDLSGKRVSLKGLRGKVVFLNFWATWCIPCREEMPAMEKLHREFKGNGLEVVAVNIRESRKEARRFFTELGITFTGLLDAHGEVAEEYGAWSIPISYLIDRKGEFIGKAIGYRRWESEESWLFFREVLAEEQEAAR